MLVSFLSSPCHDFLQCVRLFTPFLRSCINNIPGDHGRDQVVNLHYMLTKATVKARPSVLWCYKKDLGFTSHHKKRMKKIKRDIARGLRQPDEENPFELFVACTDIKYAYYKDSHRVLGNTYGMCVLQDFSSITPNVLARTIETVEGGGIVVLLLKTMSSLQQLYSMTMDVHDRYRTEAHQDVVNRFNERFLLSLGLSSNCLVVDDELNILPISSHVKKIKKITLADAEVDAKTASYVSQNEGDLNDLKETMSDTQPVGCLVDACRTLDQAKAVLTFVEAVSEKTLRNTVVLTAARGRGKSAAMGISMAGAVAYGYSNIFVTAPSPENLGTLFEMVLKGFDQLGYTEHQDYELVQSTNPDFNKAIVRINIFQNHRQTIQYIQPQDYERLAQAELLVIDEAAAIPLPIVKKLLGPYLVFMSSTVNGYEGTGRSLSLKLVKQLRQQSASVNSSDRSSASARVLREVTLDEPIRYGLNCPIEKWLNDLLCLDCSSKVPRIITGVPHPSQCELYHVNRDTLFSYHKASETFLQRMMALYVSSHYKNSPDDLQLMSDAPAHRLFVLLGPVTNSSPLPDILCVVQVALEGEISKESVLSQLARGERKAGDLIPWCISQQFQNKEFASLSGARIVRIATHPELNRMGYASRAVELLSAYYEGKMTSLDEDDDASMSKKQKQKKKKKKSADANGNLLTETIAPKKDLPPLLEKLTSRPAEQLHYVGVSYGVTQGLFNFWNKSGFVPVYLRQTANSLTGEHTCIMIKSLRGTALDTVSDAAWTNAFYSDFRRRFIELSSISFRHFTSTLALRFLDEDKNTRKVSSSSSNSIVKKMGYSELNMNVTEFDMRRLEAYARNMVDYHMILDLLPFIARQYFLARFDIKLSHTQAAILLSLGVQRKTVTEIESDINLGSTQILALFNKALRKVVTHFRSLEEKVVEQEISSSNSQQAKKKDIKNKMKPLNVSLENELNAEGNKMTNELRLKQKMMLDGMDLEKYAIGGNDGDWEKALNGSGKSSLNGGNLSVRVGSGKAIKEKSVMKRKKSTKKKSGKPKRARKD